MPRHLWPLLLLSIIGGVFGCAPANPEFAAISDDLDSDGELYELRRTADSNVRLRQRLTELLLTLSRSNSENQLENEVQKWLIRADFFRSLSGWDEIIATGASSRRISPDTFRNTYVVLSKPGAPGLIWNVFPDAAPNGQEILGQLPGSTLAVLQLSLNLANLYGSGPYQALLPDWLREGFADQDVPFRLREISGVWQLAWLGKERVLVTLPDDAGNIWEYMLRLNEAADAPAPPEILKLADGCFLRKIGRRLWIFCNFADEAAVKAILPKSTTDQLAAQPDFRELAAQLPKNSCGYFFHRADDRMWEATYNRVRLDTTLPQAEMAVLSREADRLKVTMLSPRTWENMQTDLLFDVAVKLFTSCSPELELLFSLFNDDDDGTGVDDPAENEPSEYTLQPSIDALKLCAEALLRYQKREGHFPEELGKTGIEALIAAGDLPEDALNVPNVRYLYLGDWGELSSPELPLVIEDSRTLSRGEFLVLDCGGKIAEVELDKPDLLRQISILHTQRNFSEAQFSELRRRISALEKAK